jgi:hypothetical protein
VLEILNWGKHPAWGYWKHPPLQPWVADAAFRLSGGAVWSVYVASQLSLSLCFWAVWRLARDVVSPTHALLSVLLLEGVLFYSYNTPKFNHDALQLPLWALTVLFLWRALTRARRRDWLSCGAAAGLGLLSKYTIAALLLPLALFVLVEPQARRQLRTPGPYLALAAAAVLVAPHVAWLVAHGFPTVTYGLGRAERPGRFLSHLLSPLDFALNHALTLAPFGVLLGSLAWGASAEPPPGPRGPLVRPFLFTVALGPFLTYLAVSALTGFQLLSGWGTPLWSFLGVFAVHRLRPALTPRTRRRFAGLFGALAAFWVVAFVGQYAWGPALTGRVKPEHFPGRRVAAYVTREWRARDRTPLPVVAGDKWLTDNVGAYSPDRPDVYDLDDPDTIRQPWASDADLSGRGGVIVWDAGRVGAEMPAAWRARFPKARTQPVATFAWQTRARVPPVRLGSAVLPPGPTRGRP